MKIWKLGTTVLKIKLGLKTHQTTSFRTIIAMNLRLNSVACVRSKLHLHVIIWITVRALNLETWSCSSSCSSNLLLIQYNSVRLENSIMATSFQTYRNIWVYIHLNRIRVIWAPQILIPNSHIPLFYLEHIKTETELKHLL